MNTSINNSSGFTVGALLKVLTSLPQDINVVVSSDEEGNEFGLLFRVEQADDCIILYPASGTVEMVDGDTLLDDILNSLPETPME